MPGSVLKEFWGYESFRPPQEEIIQSVLKGNDTFALLPTGGGKSICYQVPALCQEGICIVISPLISLMQDQVNDLNERGIKAMAINSFMNSKDIDRCLDNAVYGNFKMLYVSPERLKTEMFIERFKKMNVSFIAVDEAHCISQWGYDFRPSYLDIHELREIQNVPIMALTATATEEVVQDIISNLGLKNVNPFKKSFARNNIHFKVLKTENKLKHAINSLENIEGCGIVYVRNRRKCREIAEALNSNGISASYYHAGLRHDKRQEVQDEWMANKKKVIVATNAFGMGIDKSDVRFVLHWDLPDSIEAFYQEAGRAGRDGKNSYSMMMYSDYDLNKVKENLERSHPPIQEIISTYQQLGNFFQIAQGSAYMESFSFNLNEFAERYKKDLLSTFNCLKQLEQEGLITLSDGIYQPSELKIHGDKNDILSFRREHSAYESLIGFLLRAYGGILEQEVRIDERDISRKTGLSIKEVITKLNYLQQINFITYTPRHSEPTITFLTERLSENNISISSGNYNTRKEAHKKRIDGMISYALSQEECRTGILLNYFNELDYEEFCGHCDVCDQRQMKSKISESDILNFIGENEKSLDDVVNQFQGQDPRRIEKLLRKMCELEILKLKKGMVFSKK